MCRDYFPRGCSFVERCVRFPLSATMTATKNAKMINANARVPLSWAAITFILGYLLAGYAKIDTVG